MWYKRFCLVVGSSAIGAQLFAQSSRLEQESLFLLPGVYIEVTGITPQAGASGLSADSLRSDIEAILTRSRVPVLSQPQWQVTIGQPALHLAFQFVQPSPRMFVYHVSLQVRQLTRLMRDSTRMVFTRTWTAGDILGAMPATSLPELRERVRPLVRRFVAAYYDSMERPRQRALR